MFTIRRTTDPEIPTTIVRELWDYLVDDSGMEPSDYEAYMGDDYRWYVVWEEGEAVAAFSAVRQNHVTWRLHANVRREKWGNGQGTAYCKAALTDILEDTGALKVVATIPTCCPQTMRMAEALGFQKEGVAVRSWQKNGKLFDIVHYGITRT